MVEFSLTRNGFSSLMQFHHRPLLAQLQHDVDIERVIEEAVEADNVLVVQRLVNLNFLGHFLLLIVLHHQLLRDDFSGVSVAGLNIHNLVAFCEPALRVMRMREISLSRLFQGSRRG